MSPMPDGPWIEVSVDFHGPVGNGAYIMVLIDEYSLFPLIKIIGTTAGRYTSIKGNIRGIRHTDANKE